MCLRNGVPYIPAFGLFAIALVCLGCSSGTHPPISVSVSATATTLQVGTKAQITAIVLNDSGNKGVSWTLSCSSAPCGSVLPTSTPSGTATVYTPSANPPTAGMTVTITATSLSDSSKTASVTITVLGPSVSVSVTPATATVQAGTSAQFVATVSNDPANKGVTWTVSCATTPCGTVSPTTSASGTSVTYTAPAGLPAGDLAVQLTATSVANNAELISAQITVPGTDVSLAPTTATVPVDTTAQFTATVTNDPQNKGVTWSVSCATTPCGTVSPTTSASGTSVTYTAPSTPTASDLPVTLTVTSVFNPLVTGTASVLVPAVTVTVSAQSALIPTNANQQFSATVGNDTANKGVAWTLTQGGIACSPACGNIAPTNTASGAATIYTAPPNVPTSPMVALTATSAFDPTKSDVATITVSSGTVKLVPLALNFGSEVAGGTKSAQTTLTNTGNSVLGISRMTFSGTDTGDFSLTQANPCGASVAVANACTISVTFSPKATGNRSANLIITDTSTDSPQQVSLSGSSRQLCNAQIKNTLNGTSVRYSLATVGTAKTPTPSGRNSVGTRSLRLIDSSREDPFLENGKKRELMVRFWYPASLEQDCARADYTSPAVWSYFAQLMGLPLPAVTTNSCQDAPITGGPHPVVIFTHGYTGTFTDYTFLSEDLASRGYVVASIDHTYEATAVQFPDGRFVRSGFGSHLGKTVLEDDASLAFALSVRLDDLKFVTDELKILNRSTQSPFAGQLDTNRVAVAGHSMGALATAVAVQRDPRFKAAIIIDVHDGNVPQAVVGSTQTPVFILGSGREQWTENECRLWNNLRGTRFAVNFEGDEHLTPSDAVWLAKNAVKTGTMGPDKTIAAFRNYIAAFLDLTLENGRSDPILTGPSPEYPDAVAVAPGQSLCSRNTNRVLAVQPSVNQEK
jgi:dienelactone hydrolase